MSVTNTPIIPQKPRWTAHLSGHVGEYSTERFLRVHDADEGKVMTLKTTDTGMHHIELVNPHMNAIIMELDDKGLRDLRHMINQVLGQ